tara:strand:- start:390 stop:980 length:591 start_codon:yes stop_codon:yes gene_type:complete
MRYFIIALVVSLAWFHQDWFIWPFLGELYEQQNYVPAFVNDLSEDEQLAYTAAFARNREHELVMGLPLGVHFQMFLSFATAAVALLAVWKAWPTELERWAEAGNRGNSGDRDRDRGRGRGRGRGDRNRGGRNRSRGDDDKNSGRSTERSAKDDSSRSHSKEGGDTSDRPRRRRRRGGRGRGGSGGGNSQSQPKAGE